jgi:hypothetical protein
MGFWRALKMLPKALLLFQAPLKALCYFKQLQKPFAIPNTAESPLAISKHL